MSLIGTPVARPDARAKVTGAANYPADLIRAGMLHCKSIFAHRAHARIVSIDTAAAIALPGVVAVFTAADVPYNHFGLIDADQEVLCSERVRYEGDRVDLIGFSYDNLPRKSRGGVLPGVSDHPARNSFPGDVCQRS